MGSTSVLGASLVEALEQQVESRCFMLGWLDKPITGKSRGPAHEMERLLAFCQDAILPEAPTEAILVYDPAGFLFEVFRAVVHGHVVFRQETMHVKACFKAQPLR